MGMKVPLTFYFQIGRKQGKKIPNDSRTLIRFATKGKSILSDKMCHNYHTCLKSSRKTRLMPNNYSDNTQTG